MSIITGRNWRRIWIINSDIVPREIRGRNSRLTKTARIKDSFLIKSPDNILVLRALKFYPTIA